MNIFRAAKKRKIYILKGVFLVFFGGKIKITKKASQIAKPFLSLNFYVRYSEYLLKLIPTFSLKTYYVFKT